MQVVHVPPNYYVFRWGHWTPEPFCMLEFQAYGCTCANIRYCTNKLTSELDHFTAKALSHLSVPLVKRYCNGYMSIRFLLNAGDLSWKLLRLFFSLSLRREEKLMAELHNSDWPAAAAAAASILLADSQLGILGRASPNKGSTSSHKREYPETANLVQNSHCWGFIFQFSRDGHINSPYRHQTLSVTRVNMMLFTFICTDTVSDQRSHAGCLLDHSSHGYDLKPRRIHEFRWVINEHRALSKKSIT